MSSATPILALRTGAWLACLSLCPPPTASLNTDGTNPIVLSLVLFACGGRAGGGDALVYQGKDPSSVERGSARGDEDKDEAEDEEMSSRMVAFSPSLLRLVSHHPCWFCLVSLGCVCSHVAQSCA